MFTKGDKLWWADQGTDQIGTCDKKDGGNWKVLRNSTSPMMYMKIYNETVQKGATFVCQSPLKDKVHLSDRGSNLKPLNVYHRQRCLNPVTHL